MAGSGSKRRRKRASTRHKRRHPTPPGGPRYRESAADRKAREMGLPDGLTKRNLDLMNAEAMARFGLGVGVLVQEEERNRREARSHTQERSRMARPLCWFRGRYWELRRLERQAARQCAEWENRLRIVCQQVAMAVGPE